MPVTTDKVTVMGWADWPKATTLKPNSVFLVGDMDREAGSRTQTVDAQTLLDYFGGKAAQRARVQTATDGTFTWTYPVPYPANTVPIISCTAEGVAGSTDSIEVHPDGPPTNTQCRLKVTRSVRTQLAVLGAVTVMVGQAQPGATWIHLTARPAP